MFDNLEAEQARKRLTNQAVADYLNLSRVSYESKKKSGKFTILEALRLSKLFSKTAEYLFAINTVD